MATKNAMEVQKLVVDKEWLRQKVIAMNAEIGLDYDPTATAEESRRMIEAAGIRPEENLFSCGILTAREEE
jgi:hypothetical protein